jgi:predicted ribosome quality control (RQC) complex YloA/Tae2 family protein
MFPSFNTVQESPTNSKIEEEVTKTVVKELSNVDDAISKLEEMKEDLSNEIEQLVEKAEVTTSNFEQKQIEEKLETAVTTVEVVSTLLHELNEEVDLPSPMIPSPKPSSSEPVFKNIFESETVFTSPEIEKEVKERLDDTNIIITNKIKEVKKISK